MGEIKSNCELNDEQTGTTMGHGSTIGYAMCGNETNIIEMQYRSTLYAVPHRGACFLICAGVVMLVKDTAARNTRMSELFHTVANIAVFAMYYIVAKSVLCSMAKSSRLFTIGSIYNALSRFNLILFLILVYFKFTVVNMSARMVFNLYIIHFIKFYKKGIPNLR